MIGMFGANNKTPLRKSTQHWVDCRHCYNSTAAILTLCAILADTKSTDENNKIYNYYGWTFKLVDWLQ